ncbi:MAG: zf-HC2 domain-containing protein [Chloroflexi bacterium]|nr:zf-HC2 domain-containing protein [Chloroflexota bacterium]
MNTQSSMTCREVRQTLPAFIHRELPAAQRTRFARHLDTCDACHARYTRERDLVQSMSAAVPMIGRGAEAGRFELMWRERSPHRSRCGGGKSTPEN